jgi:hypothetical protein
MLRDYDITLNHNVQLSWSNSCQIDVAANSLIPSCCTTAAHNLTALRTAGGSQNNVLRLDIFTLEV